MLLYLGAFLLVISALIFASSRDEALSGGWRVALLAVYTAGFIGFGWLLRRWPRVREAGPVFLAIGALMTPLNFLLLYNEVLSDREVSAALVWFLGSIYSTAFYGFLFARGYGRLYILPAGAALLSAWAALAVTDGVPFEWSGPWWLPFPLGGIRVMGLARRWSVVTAAPLAAIAALATLFAHVAPLYVEGPPEHRWQLPVTHALLLAMAVVAGGPRRPALTLVAAMLLAVSTAWAGMWAAEWSAQWYNFPPLVAVAVVLATRPRWEGWSPWLPRAMSVLTAAGALSPFAFIVAHDEGDAWIAAAAFLASAALSGAIAWRNTTDGLLSGELAAPGRSRAPLPTHPLERIGFGWLAFGSLLIAVGFAQRALGIDAPDTGWAYAVIGVATSAVLVVATRHAAALLWAALPALLLTTLVSLQPIESFSGHDVVLLGVPAVHTLVAFALLRRWSLAVTGVALGMLALAALWESQAWQWWRLAGGYAAISVALFGGLTPLRRYAWPEGARDETLAAAQALSWVPLVAAVLTAIAALAARVGGVAIEAVTTVEYRALVLVVLTVAPLLAFDAWRVRRWELLAVAQVVLLGAVAAAWPVFGWPTWTLAATFAAAGVSGFFALWPWRRIGRDSPELAVQALSWLPSAAAVLAAAVALDMRVGDTGIDGVTTVEYRTLVLVVLSLAPLIALEAWRLRRWEPGVAAAAVLAAAMAAWWPAFDWPLWTLAATYSLAGVGGFFALSPWRSAGSTSDAVAIQILSWGGLVLGPLTAMVVMDLRLDTLDAHPASLVEFRVLAVLFLPLAAAASFDGYRLGIRWAALPASALAMVALELAIATLQPGNVQAYTLPAALYLALVGLLARSSDELHPNLGWHEVMQLAGAGLLVIPQAEQGFDPGGARWGLVLLVEGLALLAVAMVLNARWLGVSAVVTLSGVAMRFLWVNRQTDVVPYWVMLAVAGFFLLAVGVTVLLQRDWWDRSRTRLLRRWRQDAVLDARAPEAIPTVALFAALAPVLAILVVAHMD